MSEDRASKKARELADAALKRSAAARAEEVAMSFADGQLVLWNDSERGMPNELLRCALFSAKNRKEPRKTHGPQEPLRIPIIGGGEVCLIGQELRQDDENVWAQLFHMAKDARSEWVEFTPHSFIKTLRWPNNGASYTRLLASIRRLSTTGLELYSARFDRGMSFKLVSRYEYSKDTNLAWKVQVYDRQEPLLLLFDKLYSRLDWNVRLSLPEGMATWLHGFFTTHREPYPHKVETLAIGAGITLESPEDAELDDAQRLARRKSRLREAKKTVKRGLEALVASGFLSSYAITTKGLVSVVRST